MDLECKILIDNNVILDYFLERNEFFKPAKEIIKLSEQRVFTGILSSNSVTDIYYFLKRNHGHNTAIKMIKEFSTFLKIVPVGKKDIMNSMLLDFNDLEDALVSYCAKREKADYIITRNEKDFKNSPVKAISPDKFLSKHLIKNKLI
jgi:predicted nucleic acid-binding protein